MTTESFYGLLSDNFPYEPTEGQKMALRKISGFLADSDPGKVFVLKGYAGTGKTTLVSVLVSILPQVNLQSALLAPTGRAAKVLSGYSGKKAFTIHRKIYSKKATDESVRFQLMPNLHSNTVFIVDEASMIHDDTVSDGMFRGNSLLSDLLEYVGSGSNCKIILIGDNAQLPPVGSDESPALNINWLKSSYGLNIETEELREVVRQKSESGILFNATDLRYMMEGKKKYPPVFTLENFKDIVQVTGEELEDLLNESYSLYDKSGAMVICRSNKRANIFNQQIRTRILWQEDEIAAGDLLMVVKNNYFWLPENSTAGFIANGDIIEIQKIRRIKEMYGFRYAEAVVRMIDYPDEPELELMLLLDSISYESPSMPQNEQKRLFNTIMEDYAEFPKGKRMKELKNNPYYNALQVKFAYAITCHKAQGGQWPCVFIDQGYIDKENIDLSFLRWLYTAVTRATQKLYLVNFNESLMG
jgi:exodeoxyribonuclease V